MFEIETEELRAVALGRIMGWRIINPPSPAPHDRPYIRLGADGPTPLVVSEQDFRKHIIFEPEHNLNHLALCERWALKNFPEPYCRALDRIVKIAERRPTDSVGFDLDMFRAMLTENARLATAGQIVKAILESHAQITEKEEVSLRKEGYSVTKRGGVYFVGKV